MTGDSVPSVPKRDLLRALVAISVAAMAVAAIRAMAVTLMLLGAAKTEEQTSVREHCVVVNGARCTVDCVRRITGIVWHGAGSGIQIVMSV